MCLCVDLFVFILLGFFVVVVVPWMYRRKFFIKFGESSTIILQIFVSSISSSCPFGNFIMHAMCNGELNGVPHFSEPLYLFSFFPYCLGCKIAIDLFSSSLILSSDGSNLLLNLFSRFFFQLLYFSASRFLFLKYYSHLFFDISHLLQHYHHTVFTSFSMFTFSF